MLPNRLMMQGKLTGYETRRAPLAVGRAVGHDDHQDLRLAARQGGLRDVVSCGVCLSERDYLSVLCSAYGVTAVMSPFVTVTIRPSAVNVPVMPGVPLA